MIDFKEYIFYNIEKPLIFNSGLFLFYFWFSQCFILLRKQRIARAVWTILFFYSFIINQVVFISDTNCIYIVDFRNIYI